MDVDGQVVVQPESLEFQFERLDGELDAGMVFAAAAEEAYQLGNRAFGDACSSDAQEEYAKVLEILFRTELAVPQRENLELKLSRLRQLLDRLARSTIPAIHEAA